MHCRMAASTIITVISFLLMSGCGNQQIQAGKTGQRGLASARTLIGNLCDNNLGPIRNECDGGLQRKSAEWVPAVSNVMNQQLGRAKGVSFVSSEVPAQGWTELTWSIEAERRNYQMRVSYLSGKIRHLAFRTSSGQPWTHVGEIASGQAIR